MGARPLKQERGRSRIARRFNGSKIAGRDKNLRAAIHKFAKREISPDDFMQPGEIGER